MPLSLQETEPIGDGLVKAAKDGVIEGVGSSMGDLVKTALVEGGKIAFQAAVQGAIQAMK
jgi:hypothetical protein